MSHVERVLDMQVSKACTSICMWVIAMFQYHKVTLSVAPKRAALASAEAQREQTMALLTAAQSKLKVGLTLLNCE
jgi:dynein heavy chain, axonemal